MLGRRKAGSLRVQRIAHRAQRIAWVNAGDVGKISIGCDLGSKDAGGIGRWRTALKAKH